MIGNLAISWITSHQDFVKGIVIGWASAHVGLMVKFAFQQAMKIPGAHAFVVANLPQIEDGIDELKKDVEQEASKDSQPK